MKKYKDVLIISEDEGDRQILADAFNIVSPASCIISLDGANCGLNYLSDSKNPVPDIIFLDRNMHAMDGKECVKKIKGFSYLS